MNTQTQDNSDAVMRAALKMAIEFIDEITNAAGKYPYVNKTSLVVDSYAMASKLKEALSQPSQEVECSNHPDAPHGFCRDASHSAGRYVCECEGWEVEQPAQEPVKRTIEEFVKDLEQNNPEFSLLMAEQRDNLLVLFGELGLLPKENNEQAPCEQPAQKPFAYTSQIHIDDVKDDIGGERNAIGEFWASKSDYYGNHNYGCIPIYLHPAPEVTLAPDATQWHSLSDEDISLMAWNECSEDWNDLNNRKCWLEGYKSGAKAIEQELKRKNGF